MWIVYYANFQTKFHYTPTTAFIFSFTNQISLSVDVYFENDLFVVCKTLCTHQTSAIFKCGCFCNAYPLKAFFYFDSECWSNHFVILSLLVEILQQLFSALLVLLHISKSLCLNRNRILNLL